MKSIRSKIMWLLFSSVLVCSLVIGAFCIFLTSIVIEENSNDNMALMCELYSKDIDVLFASAEDSVNTLAHLVSSESFSVEDMKDAQWRKDFSESLEKNALHHVQSVEGSEAVYLYFNPELGSENTGFCYVRNHSTDSFAQLNPEHVIDFQSDTKKNLWNTTVKNKTGTWLEFYYNSNLQRNVISYAVPIFKDGQLLGILGTHLSTEYVEEVVKQIPVFKSGKLAVLKSDGTVMYHPTFEQGSLLGEGNPGFDGVIDRLSSDDYNGELTNYSLNGIKKMITGHKMRSGMMMVCFAPASEIYHERTLLTTATTGITLAVILFGFLFTFFLSRTIATPIKKLNEAAKHLTDGEYDFHSLSHSKDELGELSATLSEARKMIKHQMHRLDDEAHRDGLTGVNNKSAFLDREVEINREIASENAAFYVAVFDVNKLKITNDFFGHMAGDKLLSVVSAHLSSYFDPENIYRIGGDEFVVIIPEEKGVNCNKLVKACSDSMKKLSVEGFPDCVVSCAYGLVRYDPEKDSHFSDVVHRADKEMYKHKADTRKDILPWQAGGKSLKQLQIEKYGQLLQNLTTSTDDYLYLLNTETGVMQFFGEIPESFQVADGRNLSPDITKLLSYVHTNDHKLVTDAITSVIGFESDEVNIDFRMHSPNSNQMRWVNCRGKIIHDENDTPFVMIGRISLNAVKHLYSPITTLFNKAKLKAGLQKGALPPFTCLMLLDIDNFSEINLKHGSVYGENLLRAMAEELESRFEMWQIYHSEKDLFVVLLDIDSTKEAERIFEEIKTALSKKCSISASLVPNDRSMYINAENIYDYAVQILDNAQKESVGQLALFSKDGLMEQISTVELLEELKESVKKKCSGFSLVYQPQISADGYSISSAEALLRYESPTKGPVYPGEFIPILEQADLIHEVGLWVANEALSQCKKWRKFAPDFKICVNLSPQQLKKKRVAAQIVKLLSKHDLPGKALILEITESAQLDENEETYAVLTKLKQVGIQIAIDDFGTGYSNLGNLKHIDANILKVDRIFIQGIKENGYNYNLVRNIVEFARENDLKVCLEGVEAVKEFITLSPLHPDLFQGYLFDKPMSPEDLETAYFQEGSQPYEARQKRIEQLIHEKNLAPVVKMETKTILRSMDVGLWTIRINTETGKGEFHTNDTMRTLLGVNEQITPAECYQHWRKGIKEGYTAAVDAMVLEMAQSEKVVHVEYQWYHPEQGEVTVRCSGRCAEKQDNVLIFEGFHRIISGDMNSIF